MNVSEEVTHREICGQFGALRELGKRFLPTINSDLRVGKLLSYIGPVASSLLEQRDQIGPKLFEKLKSELGPTIKFEDLSKLTQQELIARINEAQSKWDEMVVNVTYPSARITPDDLPVEREGDNGREDEKRNDYMRGTLIGDLGRLFIYPEVI